MFENGQYYTMVLNGKRVTFRVISIDSNGNIIGRLEGNQENITFNSNELYQREIVTIQHIPS